jgi:integrase
LHVSWQSRSDGTFPSTSSASTHEPERLATAVDAANAKLIEAGIAPLGSITFHSLRRTYASLRCVCGDDIRYAADQLGHEDPRFTLRCYAQASKRRERLAEPQLKAYDQALEWARMGTSADLTVPKSVAATLS